MDLQKIEEVVNNAKYFSGHIQILEKGKIVLNIATSYSKREDEILNNTNTAFGIASGTKGFTALAILSLVDQGKLSLEDKVFKKLPYDFPNMDKNITVRQLLTHTSGIYDYFDEEVIEDFGQLFEKVPAHKILGPKDMLPLLIEGEAYFKPGEKFKYSNSGFVILGMLIEVISGISYSNYIQKEVCEPLDLTETGCFKSNQLPKNCANGYLQDDKGNWYSNIFEIPIACTADGGIFTTAGDIAKMWQGLISGNFLSKRLLAEVLSIQADINWDDSENLYYGLGFYIQLNQDKSVKNYFLMGADPGISFSSNYYVDEERIVTILGNTSDHAEILQEEISTYLDIP